MNRVLVGLAVMYAVGCLLLGVVYWAWLTHLVLNSILTGVISE